MGAGKIPLKHGLDVRIGPIVRPAQPALLGRAGLNDLIECDLKRGKSLNADRLG